MPPNFSPGEKTSAHQRGERLFRLLEHPLLQLKAVFPAACSLDWRQAWGVQHFLKAGRDADLCMAWAGAVTGCKPGPALSLELARQFGHELLPSPPPLPLRTGGAVL